MDFSLLIDRDITVHTTGHKYRGVLVDILTTERAGISDPNVLAFKMGIDDFYIDAHQVVAVTVHGREIGKETLDDE